MIEVPLYIELLQNDESKAELNPKSRNPEFCLRILVALVIYDSG